MNQPRLLPLPPAVTAALSKPGTSRSLVFDRGFDQWTPAWEVVKATKNKIEGRQAFLATFAKSSKPPVFKSSDYESRQERRRRVLESLGARTVTARTESRLVMGLGLSHPTETGLLLDRLTGSPYLPGTSVKGLLRAAARWVGEGELEVPEDEDAAGFWSQNRDRLFGPALGGDATAAKGELIVYDAFPERWPGLELDILTPHYSPYYSNGKQPPADWHDPTPVPFLTVKAGTSFLFAFGSRNRERETDDLDRVESLLRVALSELGIGGKTGAGYGVFRAQGAGSAGEKDSESILWRQVQLTWEPGNSLLHTTCEGQTAELQYDEARALLDRLPEAARVRLTGEVPGKKKRKKKKPLTCDVEVVPVSPYKLKLVALNFPGIED
jgi:CRISPR-associated protein Cmr6